MTDKPLRADPEDRPVPPPEGHHLTRAVAAARIAAAAPEPAPVTAATPPDASGGDAGGGDLGGKDGGEPAGAEAAPAPAGTHTRPIRPARTKARGQPLAWSGFLLGALALVFAIGLATLLWRFAGEERIVPPTAQTEPQIEPQAAPGIVPEATPEIAPEPTPAFALTPDALLEMETLLDQLGFPPGPVDGVIDAESTAAIHDFQMTAGLVADGAPSDALLEELRAALAELTGEN